MPRHKMPEQRRAQLASLAAYQFPILSRSLGQLASTVPPYFALIALMYAGLSVSIWLTFALAFPGRLRRPHVHHPARLRPWLVLRLPHRQQCHGLGCSLITFTLTQLATAPRTTPCHLEQPRPPTRGSGHLLDLPHCQEYALSRRCTVGSPDWSASPDLAGIGSTLCFPGGVSVPLRYATFLAA